MAASDTFSYHVHGPIIPTCPIGTAGAWVPIGECEDGADIDFQIFTKPIKHDGGGGPEGAETNDIFLNMIATIRMNLVPFAGTRINSLRAKAHAGATDGTMIMPGTLYGENSMYVGLFLPVLAGEGDGGWWFKACRVVKPGSNKVSTKETKLAMEFRAINYFAIASQNTISTTLLYSRTTPP